MKKRTYLLKIREKLEILRRARKTITLNERNAPFLNVDSWMANLLADSPGLIETDQGNIKMVFAKARALCDLENAIDINLPKAVDSLLEDHKSLPENLFKLVIANALHSDEFSVTTMTSILNHPSFSEKAFRAAVDWTFNGRSRAGERLLPLLLKNRHTRRFSNLLFLQYDGCTMYAEDNRYRKIFEDNEIAMTMMLEVWNKLDDWRDELQQPEWIIDRIFRCFRRCFL